VVGVTTNFLAVTLFGFTYSATAAFLALVVVAVVIAVVWHLATRGQ